MADKMTKTTSSISLEKQPVNTRITKATLSLMPNAGEVQIVTRLAENITESYTMLTQKQQKLNDLTNRQHYHQQHLKRIHNECPNNAKLLKPKLKAATDEWHEVCSSKNKLKRKKTLSASLTSVTDSVNQEKRTRIEGMQLNCRGRLHIKENINAPSPPTTNTLLSASVLVNPPDTPVPLRTERLTAKPPLPPSTKYSSTESKPVLNPPPRLKRKLQENVYTIHKLNALTEQLRLEINELKLNLNSEKGAVRVLRAQNESEARKWKTEVKKLQNALELLKKTGFSKKCDTTNSENLPQAAMGNLVSYEIQRLTNEINNLKEANKALEEKKMINCDADRRKAADLRELRDSYEIRLTQIQKSAKNEISRLLEEIKSKERNIGQLKKDLQILQNSKTASRNATTFNTNQTNKTTNLNGKTQINKKPKTSPLNGANKQNNEPSKETPATTANNKDLSKKAEGSNEISKLKNIELINNTKNVTTNLQRPTKILTNHHNNSKEPEIIENNNENTITIIHKHLKALETPVLHAKDNNDGRSCCMNLLQKKNEPTLVTTATQTTDTSFLINSPKTMKATATATTQTPILSAATFMISPIQETCNETDHFDEQQITQELTQHLENKAIQDAKENHHCHQRRLHHHHHHDHQHHQNNHSDSDSALSSAPTSISPQPPANGEEPADLWQTMRNYSNDIDRLQKEVDLLRKQNEDLIQELNLAKDQIVELETNAMESANNSKISELMKRINFLEDQERQWQAEANDLREQNELLEFRILELEETHDKWSLQSNTNPTLESSQTMPPTTTTTTTNATQNVWSCPGGIKENNNQHDPFEVLFGSKTHTSNQMDSGIISPQSQHHYDELIDISNEELCRRLGELLKKASLHEDERHCLQQVLNLVQQIDALMPRSGPNSLNATSSSDETNSLDLVKSRVSDYSSVSSTSAPSGRLAYENCSANLTKVDHSNSSNLSTPSRIVATVQPYNSSVQIAPLTTPTDSPRKLRCQPWQTNSLSESGVFVESDFYSDISEHNACTQTDFEDGGLSIYSTHHILNSPIKKVPVQQQNSANLTDQKRLQYYKERVEILEGKVYIYESSGDVQAKRLAERLQREIQLEKELNELRDRVEFLESENSNLEEEKCEFEEAENDTRLRLQRLEVELEILSQRNVELEMSREAQSAKYKDCHSECLILRDDLAASETQIRHLEEEKQKAKENLEFLYNTLPLLLIYNTYCTLAQVQNSNYQVATVTIEDMGNQNSNVSSTNSPPPLSIGGSERNLLETLRPCRCHERELQHLKDEIKCLRHQIKELNSRHYAAMESADSHWVDLEKEYKEREEQFRAKEMCLKQKIQKLQDCLREDARSANEKICQLEEAEQGLKTCLVKVSKDHQKLQEDYQLMMSEFDHFKEQHEQVREQQKPLTEALECEKKRNKGLLDELTFMRKLQQETESHAKKELEGVRDQIFDLKKDFLHIEVTNGELREEVATLELQIKNLEKAQQESEEKIRCLTDEIRTKDEICQRLERRLQRTDGYSLADELGDSPSKRFKRESVKDLKTAAKGLGQTLKHMGDCERMLPTQNQFKTIARDVKKLADSLLQSDAQEEEETLNKSQSEFSEESANSESIDQNQMELENIEFQSSDSFESGQQPSQNVSYENIDILPNYTIEEVAALSSEEDLISKELAHKPKVNVTVGMVVVPQTHVNESSLSSICRKKVIYEVPSEMRKLANSSKSREYCILDDCSKTKLQLTPQIKRGKCSGKIRMCRGRVGSLYLKVRRMTSPCFYQGRLVKYEDGSESAVGKSEILQQSIAYGSFHSIQPNSATVVSVGCETDSDTKATAIGTFIKTRNYSIQVNDEIAAELLAASIPKNIRSFLETLKSTSPNEKLLINSSFFNMKICQCWKTDLEFRQGLDILATLSPSNSSAEKSTSLESYQDFVSAMKCLDTFINVFEPNQIPLETSEKSPQAYFDRNNQNISSFSIKYRPSNSSQTSETKSQICPHVLKFQLPPLVLIGEPKCACNQLDATSSSSSITLTSEHYTLKSDLKSAGRNTAEPKKVKTQARGERSDVYSEYSETDDETGKVYCPKKNSSMNTISVLLQVLQKVLRLTDKNTATVKENPGSLGKVSCKEKSTPMAPVPPFACRQCHCCCCVYGTNFGQDPPFQLPLMQSYNLIAAGTNNQTMPESFLHEPTDNRNQSRYVGHQTPVQSACERFPTFDLNFRQEPANIKPNHPPSTTHPFLTHEMLREEANLISSSLDDKVATDKGACTLQKQSVYAEEELHENDAEPSIYKGPNCNSLEAFSSEPRMSLEENIEEVDEEIQPVFATVKKMTSFATYKPAQDCLMEYDDEEPNYIVTSDTKAATSRENSKSLEMLTTSNKFDVEPNVGIEHSFRRKMTGIANLTTTEINENINEIIEEILPPITAVNTSPKIYRTLSPNTRKADESTHPTPYNELDHGSEEQLKKDKLSDSRNGKLRNNAPLPTLGYREGSTQEMKYFIDSLVMDLDAMHNARSKSQFEKNICKAKIGLSCRDSFPVTITEVTDLGVSSLFVKWKIHDCFGIGGYEIYTDGYLTNRYYNSRHDAAVITPVDVTLPHKIALVAQAGANDGNLDCICNMTANKNKTKFLSRRKIVDKQRGSLSTLWTPSIFLYDPITCRANAPSPITRDNF